MGRPAAVDVVRRLDGKPRHVYRHSWWASPSIEGEAEGTANRSRGYAVSDQLQISRRLLRYALGIVLCGGALFAGGSALAAKTRPAATPQFLFSIPTASGSLTGPGDKHLTLRLIGTRNYLTRFTDRPLREAFVVANVDFARRFKSYFGNSKPNAVLTYTPPGSQIPVSIVLTIGQPNWDATSATWTFPATRIRKQPDNLPDTTVHIKPPSIPNPASFKHGTLFIDSAACEDIAGQC